MSPAWDKSCQDSLIQTSKALSKFFFSKNKVEKCCDLSCQRKIFKSHNFQWCFINFVMSYFHIMEVHRGIFRILSFIMKFFGNINVFLWILNLPLKLGWMFLESCSWTIWQPLTFAETLILTNFMPMFPSLPTENIRKPEVFWSFQGGTKMNH